MGKSLLFFITVLVATLVFYVATRLSADTIAFALGVVFGVLATVPIMFLFLALHRSERKSNRQEYPTPYPMPFFIEGGFTGGQQLPQYPPSLPQLPDRVIPPNSQQYSDW